MGVKNVHFDSFKKHLETILIDMEKPQDLIEDLMVIVEQQRKMIVFEEEWFIYIHTLRKLYFM